VNWFTDRRTGSAQNGVERRRPALLPKSQNKGMRDMMDTALSALVLAWTTTMIATTLFVAALAFSQFWDNAVYVQVLQGVLSPDV
jgi:hypothetical protein